MKMIDLVEQEDEFTKQTTELDASAQKRLQQIERTMAALRSYHGRAIDALYVLTSTASRKLSSVTGLLGVGGLLIPSWDHEDYDPLVKVSPYKGQICSNPFDDTFRSHHIVISDYVIDPSTPNIKTLWPRIKNLTDKTVQYAMQYRKVDKQFTETRKIVRSETKAELDKNATGSVVTSADIKKLQKTMPEIFIGGKKIQNPLVTCALSLYAGPPEKYPDLTPTQVELLIDIQQALKVAGRPPLTMMYAGRLRKDYQAINFVAVTADNKFAWRKYDVSRGSGQNWIYYDDGKRGTKINTSAFVSAPAKYLAAIV